MNTTTAPLTVIPVIRRHTPLSAINPHSSATVRAADRAAGSPGRRTDRPVTFNSAL